MSLQTISASFAATGLSQELTLRAGESFAYDVSGTFSATLRLQKSTSLNCWIDLASVTEAASGSVLCEDANGARYRWRCSAYTSGTAVATLVDADDIEITHKNKKGDVVWTENEESVRFSKPVVLSDGSTAAGTSGGFIPATEIGTGVVSNAEFNRLDGVTAAIQTQIDGKLATGGNAVTATLAATVTVADAASDTTMFPMLAGSATGNLPVLTDSGLSYNAATNALTATTFVGALTGNADTATTAASAISATTAASAATLTTPRTINGTSFDGSANVIADLAHIIVAVSDEVTALTTGTAKVSFRMPRAMTLSAIRGTLTTAATGATLFQFNVKENGTTVFSTQPTFDASELTTTTAATASVLSDTALADDALITIDIVAVGNTIAGAGLKVALIGTWV